MTPFFEKARQYIEFFGQADDATKLEMMMRGAPLMAAATSAREVAAEANRDPSKPRAPVVNFVTESQHPFALALAVMTRRLVGLPEDAELRLTQDLVEFNATLRIATDARFQKNIPSASLVWPCEPGQPVSQSLAVVAIFDLANAVPASDEGLLFVLEDGSQHGFMLDGVVIDEPECGDRLLPLAWHEANV